jgi:hypothetical protein
MKGRQIFSLGSGVGKLSGIGLLILLAATICLSMVGTAGAAGTPSISDLKSPTHPDPNAWYADSNPAFSWSSLGSPTLAGTYNTPGHAYGVAVSGSHAYVADYEFGLQIIDISNPAIPAFVGTADTAGNANDLAVSGNYAYVADGADGLVVIDISNPASPSIAGSYNTPGDARSVAISGNYAYVADDGGVGLQIIDISNPANPTFAAGYDTTGTAYGVAISGHYAYVADGASGLQIIDVINPASPVPVGTYNTAGYAYDVAVAGNHACVADGVVGLQVIDVSNPASPILKSTYDTPASALGMDVTGNHAYVADQASGLQIIDITDPAHPILAGGYDTPGYAEDVVVAGNYVYVADYAAGLQVIKINSITGYSYVLDQAPATVPDQTVDGTVASASYSGVTDGEWYFHVRAKDGTGSWSSAAHVRVRIRHCSGAAPALTLATTGSYWASYADYTAGRLMVDFRINNASGPDAFNVAITGTVNTNSVTLATAMPLAVGDIATGANASMTLVYNLPVESPPAFRTTVHASAQDLCGSSFSYPSP